ncbi:hypothetical protein EIP86_005872 [Pleurotus ostreatoroseus]|nr:hypothetical protein EIP86_005872 [Pleurotus ostreatoroseus]
MASPLSQPLSNSSDYFDNDPDFIRALQEIELPGDAPRTMQGADRPHRTPSETQAPLTQASAEQSHRKRRRDSEDDDDDDDREANHRVLASIDQDSSKAQYLDSHTYGASRFGEFGEYMSRKRAKLQIQNTEMDEDGEEIVQKSRIFQGLEIYINGYTEPSIQDLRKLIIQHGGVFHAYLDKKSLVTHVLTCSLTPAKIREFRYMKVVRPEWLVESAQAGMLLPWHDYIFKQDERLEDAQGKRAGQKSLMDGFATQTPKQPSRRRDVPTQASSFPESNRSHDADISETSMAVDPPTPPRTPTKLKPSSKPATPSSSSKRPLIITDPSTEEQAKRVPSYAEAGSNKAAERAMADPSWRAAHTSVSSDFIEGYYRNSRLHHLSAWKAELKVLVAEAQERAETGSSEDAGKGAFVANENDGTVGKVVRENMRGKGSTNKDDGDGDVTMRGAHLVRRAKGKDKAANNDEKQVIMHCDFDSFFVSAGLIDRPHLRGKPVVVCHSQGAQGGKSSTSEIASASYEARKYGIKGGMSLQQARKLCPTIMTIPYEFQRYKQFSLQFYTILMAHADDLQAVSVDEALIDVTSSVRRIETEMSLSQDCHLVDAAKEFAEAIRAQVRKATGCEVSIGIAHNIMLARLASRKAKPAGSYHLRPSDVPVFIAPLHIDDLHGFGRASYEKAQEKLGTTSLGELAKMSKAVLCEALGKGTGETLYNAVRGIDHRKLESDKPRKSVSCDINYGIRFENNEQAEAFIYQLAEEVSRRLDSVDMRGRALTLKVMKRDPNAPVEAPKFMGHGICESFTKQAQLMAPGGRATSDHTIIGEHAWRLLRSMNIDPRELRGIAIQIQKLEKAGVGAEAEPGQAVLPFRPADTPKKDQGPEPQASKSISEDIVAEPPLQAASARQPPARKQPDPTMFDLPSFSQVDMSVFDALPDDVRRELEQEYKRRSVTPAIPPKSAPNRALSPISRETRADVRIELPQAGPSRLRDPALLDLPSFSQVDISVLDALPGDVRQELEQEYKRRSVTPAILPKPAISRMLSSLFNKASADVEVEPPQAASIQEPTREPDPALLDLPSFSQVDTSVLDALPDDVRQELEQEYKRRSATPAIPKPVEKRPASIFSPQKAKAKFKITVPGIPKKLNVKRITRQLAPRSRSSLAASKSRLFKNQKVNLKSSPTVQVSVSELRLFGIEPSVFYMLPNDVQREQLAYLRQKNAPRGSGLAFCSQRKPIKAKRLKGKPIPKRPPPKARYREPPTLKQSGKEKGEKLYFTEKVDVQDVIGQWVERFKEAPPNAKDVAFFSKYLVRCVDRETSGDSGIERAVAVAKWWQILLRRNFGAWEDAEPGAVDEDAAAPKAPYTSETIGRAWWQAFREVKEKMDVAASKRFGGCLSLK